MASHRITILALGVMEQDAVLLAEVLKSAARQGEIPSKSYCCASYLLALSGAKTAVIAFTYGVPKRSSGCPRCEADADLPQDLPVLVYGRTKDEEPFREEDESPSDESPRWAYLPGKQASNLGKQLHSDECGH